ncbi:hypothetical protein GOP47_0000479 [Adiantum capillus-veneris]|uniref:Kinesin motor domain-containing protein n=1 Tax=Adiantum capillus-veneris TaxID=13818 RepID=A0A9D4ZT45_ADICA|nr:hypothetical protein GOP47_0000479 [Adiantum capillus-veneris]
MEGLSFELAFYVIFEALELEAGLAWKLQEPPHVHEALVESTSTILHADGDQSGDLNSLLNSRRLRGQKVRNYNGSVSKGFLLVPLLFLMALLVERAHFLSMEDEDGDCDMHRERSVSSQLCSSSPSSHMPTTSDIRSNNGTNSNGLWIHEMFPWNTLAARTLNVYGRDGKMAGKIQFQTSRASAAFVDVKLSIIGSDLTLLTCSVSRSLLSSGAYPPKTPSYCTHHFVPDKLLLNYMPLFQHLDNDAEGTMVQIEKELSVCDNNLMLEELKNEVLYNQDDMIKENWNDVKLQRDVSRKITVLETEIGDLREKLLQQSKDLKASHDQVLELKGNIRVFCRCRPPTLNEEIAGSPSVIEFRPLHNHDLYVCTHDGVRKTFKFDRVFTPSHSQEEVFLETAPLVVSVLDGFNVCIFAYGQTGTGKTFTMEGTEANRGINYRTLEKLFQLASQRKEQCRYEISVSVLEVYNEEIRDLLTSSSSSLGQNCKKLEIKQGAEGIHHVLGAVEAPVQSIKEVWKVLQTGSRARTVGSTNANKHSSRSHCLLCVMVKGENFLTGEFTKSKLWLIDLAGSERIGKTDVCGEQLKEAQNINKSLSALGDVIHALASRNSHIPYRNSKITHLLQDSLGGQSKTLMFVQISPCEHDVGETLCSLNFASRVRGIELGAVRKQLDPAELLKYKKMVEKTREDGLKKDAIIVELQAAAKVKEQTCKALSVKVKENERLLANEKKARVTAEEKLKEQQTLIDKQRLLIEKLSTEVRAKQSGLSQVPADQKIPLPFTPRRPPLQERLTDNREQTVHHTKKRAAVGYLQKENVCNEVVAGTHPLKNYHRRGSLKGAVLQEDPTEELTDIRRRGRASLCVLPQINTRHQGRASLCVFPQREPSQWAASVAPAPPTLKFAEPRTRMSKACRVDPASLEVGDSRLTTPRSTMEAPKKIHLQSPYFLQPGCSGGAFIARRIGNINVPRGKPPQHPHQAVTMVLQYQPKRPLTGQNGDDMGRPLNKVRRLSAATPPPPPHTQMMNCALPSTPAPVLVGGGPHSHHPPTNSTGRLSMTPCSQWENPWGAALLPSTTASTPVGIPILGEARRVPLSSKKSAVSRTLMR